MRSYYWWPHIDEEIQGYLIRCNLCMAQHKQIPRVYVQSWKPASKPMDRVHTDFFDYAGQIFLIFIDSYSKWLQIELIRHNTAEETI